MSSAALQISLFDWPELKAIAALRIQRNLLQRRIARYRPHCHHRIVLEARLVSLTNRLLILEFQSRGRP